MIELRRFLSQAAGAMQESAIRRMGALLAQSRDIISFAPGYPAPETFPWESSSEIAASCCRARTAACCSTGRRAAIGRCSK